MLLCDKKSQQLQRGENNWFHQCPASDGSVGTAIKTQFTSPKNWGANIAIPHCPSTRINKPFS